MLQSHGLRLRVKPHTPKNNISQQMIPCKDNEMEEAWEGVGGRKSLVFWHGGLIGAADELKPRLTWPRVEQVNRPNLLRLRWPSGPVSWRRSLQDAHTHTDILSPLFLFCLLKSWHALAVSDVRHQVRENRYAHTSSQTQETYGAGARRCSP